MRALRFLDFRGMSNVGAVSSVFQLPYGANMPTPDLSQTLSAFTRWRNHVVNQCVNRVAFAPGSIQ